MAVSEAQLLQGAWFAMEQAGHLLYVAVDVYDAGRPGIASGIAMLAREEIGKARMLRDLSVRVKQGEVIAEDELLSDVEDHVDKQANAVLTMMLSAPAGSALARIYGRLAVGSDTDPDFHAAVEELLEIRRRRAKRLPQERHEARMRGFYVDPDGAGGWKRPVAIRKVDVGREMFWAANDYSAARNDFIADARFGVLPERPDLPVQKWPTSGIE